MTQGCGNKSHTLTPEAMWCGLSRNKRHPHHPSPMRHSSPHSQPLCRCELPSVYSHKFLTWQAFPSLQMYRACSQALR